MKKRIEERLGCPISDLQFRVSKMRSERKLQEIIERFGDEGGERRTPEYLEELIREDVLAGALAQELYQKNRQNKKEEYLQSRIPSKHVFILASVRL